MAHYWHWQLALAYGRRKRMREGNREKKQNTRHSGNMMYAMTKLFIFSLSPPPHPSLPDSGDNERRAVRGRRTNEDDERLLSQWQTGVLALRVNSLTHSTVAIQWKKSRRKERPFLPTLCPPPHPHPHAHMPTRPFPHLKVLSSPGPRDLELT